MALPFQYYSTAFSTPFPACQIKHRARHDIDCRSHDVTSCTKIDITYFADATTTKTKHSISMHPAMSYLERIFGGYWWSVGGHLSLSRSLPHACHSSTDKTKSTQLQDIRYSLSDNRTLPVGAAGAKAEAEPSRAAMVAIFIMV